MVLKGKKAEPKKKILLRAEMLYAYLTGNEDLETLVFCKPGCIELVTTDQSLYEAIAAIVDKSKLHYSKLTKLTENVKIMSYTDMTKQERRILTEERAVQIRERSAKVRTQNVKDIVSNTCPDDQLI